MMHLVLYNMADKRIDEITKDEDEFFIYLKKGYRLAGDFSQDGRLCQHCFGAVDKAEIRYTMKEWVVPCTCNTCIT